jgi:phage repressor protein C with HTH and peptisase S24 domain/DNA-binding XRE family transcriptional regulator
MEMSRFGERLKAERVSRQMSQEAAADYIGVERAAFGKVERGETTRPNDWEVYANGFGIPLNEADAMMDMDAIDEKKPSKIKGRIKMRALSSSTASKAASGVNIMVRQKNTERAGMVPVHGWAAAGDPDRLIMVNETTDWVPAHPDLGSIEGSYAVYVHGTSMIPRYYPGELVYVHPYKPLKEKDFCVVQIGEDENNPEGAYIKQFIAWHDDSLELFQFNPAQPVSIPLKMVARVHRIVGSGES